MVEVLRRYSHPEYLADLQAVQQVIKGQTVEATTEEQPPQVRRWSMAERLSPQDVAAMIEKYHAGTIAKDLAAQYGISESSVKRLLRKHGGRLCDRQG